MCKRHQGPEQTQSAEWGGGGHQGTVPGCWCCGRAGALTERTSLARVLGVLHGLLGVQCVSGVGLALGEQGRTKGVFRAWLLKDRCMDQHHLETVRNSRSEPQAESEFLRVGPRNLFSQYFQGIRVHWFEKYCFRLFKFLVSRKDHLLFGGRKERELKQVSKVLYLHVPKLANIPPSHLH